MMTSPDERRISVQNHLNLLNMNPSLNGLLKGLTIKTKDDNLAEYIDDFSFNKKNRIGS
jgi:hypothetical protein